METVMFVCVCVCVCASVFDHASKTTVTSCNYRERRLELLISNQSQLDNVLAVCCVAFITFQVQMFYGIKIQMSKSSHCLDRKPLGNMQIVTVRNNEITAKIDYGQLVRVDDWVYSL